MNDSELISALTNGDTKALEGIMKKYSGYVLTVVRNFSRGALSEDEIDEISVEVFYKLWSLRKNIEIKIGLAAYLSAAARNAVKNRFRKLNPPSEDISELEISSGFLVEDKAELSIMTECLNEGIEQLSEKDREIFLRFYLYGESASQIAKAMNITEGSVRTKLHRIRAGLKEYMSERGYDHV
ncbi:MAG: sigma-70 family RNA polymerase sigma factor [Oscillospiraceae bacterium]|nr:sigma-70 family RNA polymerase sigma factor [Oscillospiraceae bacterium]